MLALLVVSGAVAAGQVFVGQRDLQDVCDGAAIAAAAAAADLDRRAALGDGTALRFSDVTRTVTAYLDSDPTRRGILAQARIESDGRTIVLRCTQTRPVLLGALFGHAAGVRHVAESAAQAPITPG